MKNNVKNIFYIVLIAVFASIMYWVIGEGTKLEDGRIIESVQSEGTAWENFIDSLLHSLKHPLAILLAQIVTIILVARVFGWICIKINQPVVIGEMIAGIVLGPSLLGMYFPEFSAALFPVESIGNLQFLSQIGLILFMFIVGMELDLKILRNKAHDAVIISHASIIIPFTLGIGLSYFLYAEYAPSGVEFLSYSLFIGIAMSITAFPVLARIVQERGLQKTRLGTIVITCAAADDITAWCILAAVIAIVKAGSFGSAFYTILLALAYVFVMIKIIRPFLNRVGNVTASRAGMSKPIVAIFFLTLILSAYATEVIGIHALFGAFMAGAIMPESAKFRSIFVEKVEDVAMVLLLPLFFVFTGLRTQIGLLDDPKLWLITLAIIAVAVIGKFFGSAIAARFVGQSWKDSLSIGALMNTRGLMELVVLNIGYDLGVLSTELFSMMVVMALATTFMTGPALDLINWAFKPKATEGTVKDSSKFKILLSFAKSETGIALLRLADALTGKNKSNSSITALHIAHANEFHHYELDDQETSTFKEILEVADKIEQPLETVFKISSDIDHEIVQTANDTDNDLLLLGVSESIYEGSFLGKFLNFTSRIINPEKLLYTVANQTNIFSTYERTDQIQNKVEGAVGILIDKELQSIDRVFVPIFTNDDKFLISYIQKLIHNAEAQVTILDVGGTIKNNTDIKEKIRFIEQQAPNYISLEHSKIIDKEFLKEQDLMLISLMSWKKLVESKSQWLKDAPSTLMLVNSKNEIIDKVNVYENSTQN
ncbi:cation:proton antiporter [Sphingobacterium hungaricum]|uniref:Cation/H(+) antiporter n=1 Tax=Sphingobacterium hungaricum TaxID=2082723 RepID=A0A928YPW0_9SPHI|nr:cation:proton antiporter [Sphingobacterium hungaricum]MBE8712305.1 cation/H(+) antiporter [Sphingobacterium hungaricum]